MLDNLTVAILLNSGKIPLWIFRTIDSILKTGSIDVTIIISKSPERIGRDSKRNPPGLFILRLIEKTDYLFFGIKDNYNCIKEVALFEHNTEIIDLNSGAYAVGGKELDLTKTIKGINPELIIRFGYHDLPDSLLELTRFGIWTLTVESPVVPGNIDYGFWEVIRYRTTSCSSVRMLAPGASQAETIYRSVESTCPFSVNKNRNQIFHRTALFLPRLIQGLLHGGENYLVRQKERHRKWMDADPYKEISLGTVSVIKDTFRFIGRVTPLVINKLLFTDAFTWNILVQRGAVQDPITCGFERFNQLKSPEGVFWADPFVVFENGRHYIFVEEFIYKKNKAHISLLELDPAGSLINHRRVIERAYHMSYPFVFKYEGCWYMIPETASNKSVELYRCNDFPYSWEFEKVIMKDVSATDTTLFYYNDKWWLFTTLDQTGSVSGGSTELFLFYSGSPLSDKWVSHPLNPVVSDETGARCAGNLFIRDGIIYRPSQDCSVRYGRGFNLKRVTVLNEYEYNETTGIEVKPFWDKKLKGTHTFNFANGLTVIDTYSYHRRF
jgi:hypothetical protein